LISHEYESIADKIRRSHQGLTNDLAIAEAMTKSLFVISGSKDPSI